MQKRITILGAGLVVAAGLAWYAFRPELLFVNEEINEAFPSATVAQAQSREPSPIVEGSFHSVAHETQGKAAIFQAVENKRILRLTDFKTSNGPDLRVFLVAAPDAKDDETVKKAGHIELGKLKGNIGDQNYDIPAGTDLNKYRAVTIWCNRFSVNFGTAPLGIPGS